MMKTKGKIILATLAAVVILVVIAGLGLKNKIENDLKDVSRITDGVFSGQYTAFPVAAVVEVSVQNSIITNIKLVKHENGQGKPAEAILDQVIEAQCDVSSWTTVYIIKSIVPIFLHCHTFPAVPSLFP